ncbi:antimicrobial peptide ISAMP-like [Ixodes scapularis]|uniref:antimicrobial peptide ISAMP-like n=1 Tax=Ixodes scapularis TaxID=6945 RepID=UPI001A9EDF1B|nr:antimicrobial peptide ISAMP-like [Ixodes scapularis]
MVVYTVQIETSSGLCGGGVRTSKSLSSSSTSAKILSNNPSTMRAVTIFIVTLVVLESFYFASYECAAGPAWQVKAKRPKCYSKPLSKTNIYILLHVCKDNNECKFGSCSRCNNGLHGDNTCR